MATTTKTLKPTGQTVTLPDMTERPNASVLVDGIGKDADAINALYEYKAGDTYSFGGNLTPCRTLNDLSGLYFVYRLPKNISSGVTGFNITVSSASLIWGVSGASIAAGAAASNKTVSTAGVAFSFQTTGTISAAGAGICSLNATITFP